MGTSITSLGSGGYSSSPSSGCCWWRRPHWARTPPGRPCRPPTAATEPVVAYVQNPRAGVLHLMVGEREVIVEDHDLVARILNAAGRGEGR